jgi:hypothetical protein
VHVARARASFARVAIGERRCAPCLPAPEHISAGSLSLPDVPLWP